MPKPWTINSQLRQRHNDLKGWYYLPFKITPFNHHASQNTKKISVQVWWLAFFKLSLQLINFDHFSNSWTELAAYGKAGNGDHCLCAASIFTTFSEICQAFTAYSEAIHRFLMIFGSHKIAYRNLLSVKESSKPWSGPGLPQKPWHLLWSTKARACQRINQLPSWWAGVYSL